MSRLFVTQRIPPQALKGHRSTAIEVDVRDSDIPLPHDELCHRLGTYDGVVSMLTDSINAQLLTDNPQLKVVSNVAVGFDNIDVASAQERGVVVTHTPDDLTETTADLAVALALAAARRLPESDTFVRSGDWRQWSFIPDQIGTDIHGKTIGLFGMGRIAAAVARRMALGFGMQVRYASRSRHATVEADFDARRVSFEDLLGDSDILSLHAPLTPQTKGILGRAQLAQMKPTAILVNTARGALVDEQALAEALEQGKLWGAGLDVFEDEPSPHPRLLANRNRLVLAPHIGSATLQTRLAMARTALADAQRVLQGQPALHPVPQPG